MVIRSKGAIKTKRAEFSVSLPVVAVYYFEHKAQPEAFASVFHSLWWAVVTLTTVGYGDLTPVTVGGNVFTFFVLIVGQGDRRSFNRAVCLCIVESALGGVGAPLRSLPYLALSWLVGLTY